MSFSGFGGSFKFHYDGTKIISLRDSITVSGVVTTNLTIEVQHFDKEGNSTNHHDFGWGMFDFACGVCLL